MNAQGVGEGDVPGELPPELLALVEDTNRVSRTAQSFHEAKHHLVYSSAKLIIIPRYVWLRAGATGDDVLSASESLVGEFVRAQIVFAEWVRGGAARMLTFPEGRRVDTAFKSVHLWLRAYQDAVCGVWRALQGERVGAYSSMRQALKDGKPLQAFLAEQLPDYELWFHQWRERRDQMKLGAAFDTILESDPPRIRGVKFKYPRRMNDTEVEEASISLDDIVDGLDMSARLSDIVRVLVDERRAEA